MTEYNADVVTTLVDMAMFTDHTRGPLAGIRWTADEEANLVVLEATDSYMVVRTTIEPAEDAKVDPATDALLDAKDIIAMSKALAKELKPQARYGVAPTIHVEYHHSGRRFATTKQSYIVEMVEGEFPTGVQTYADEAAMRRTDYEANRPLDSCAMLAVNSHLIARFAKLKDATCDNAPVRFYPNRDDLKAAAFKCGRYEGAIMPVRVS